MPTQREAALAAANERRALRRELRDYLGEVGRPQSWYRLADAIEQNEPWIQSAALGQVMVWAKGMGPGMLSRVLTFAGVSSHTRIGALEPSQRAALATILRDPPWKSDSRLSRELVELAARRREQRSLLKRSLALGDITLIDVLREKPECCWEMPTYELIEALPGIGPVRLAALNSEALSHGVNLFSPILSLTPRARGWLASKFG